MMVGYLDLAWEEVLNHELSCARLSRETTAHPKGEHSKTEPLDGMGREPVPEDSGLWRLPARGRHLLSIALKYIVRYMPTRTAW